MKFIVKSLFLLIAGILFLSPDSFSQGSQAQTEPRVNEIKAKSSFKISGKVKDSSTGEFLQYVNVVILN